MDQNKLYYVVEFPQEEVDGSCPMAVISENSTFTDNGTLFCWWPNFKNDRVRENTVRNHSVVDPQNSTKCQIQIKYKTDSFEKAREKLKLLELSSDIDTDDPSNQKRRNFLSEKQKFKDYTLSDSDSSSETLPRIPKLNYEQKSITKKSSQGLVRNISPLQTISTSTSVSSIRSEIRSETGACKNCEKIEKTNNGFLTEIIRKQEKVNTEVNEKLDFIVGLLQIQFGTFKGPNLEDVTLPINSVKTLEEINNKINDKNVYSKYLNVLKLIGGKDVADCTRRILAKLIGHDLATQMNWSGRNDKPSFGTFGNIKTLIFDAVQANPICTNVFSQASVEKTIKAWLRGSGDREGGRTNRKKVNEASVGVL